MGSLRLAPTMYICTNVVTVCTNVGTVCTLQYNTQTQCNAATRVSINTMISYYITVISVYSYSMAASSSTYITAELRFNTLYVYTLLKVNVTIVTF